jgi:hypothetical protein
MDEGATWPKKYAIYLIETEDAPSNAKVCGQPAERSE